MVATVLVVLIGLGFWQGCNRRAISARRPTVIVVSGDTQGWIVFCGCTANQSGGLLRRATYLRQLRASADVLYFDSGGAGAGVSPYQQAKLAAIFAGENAMGISAHNLGKAELAIGPDALKHLAESTNIPLISSNARLADNTPIAPEIRIFPIQGKRLAVVGVVSPQFTVAAITVSDPKQAVIDIVARHKGEYDSLLVLAYLPDDELEQLAASIPEADAIVGGPTGQAIVPRHLGPVLLASATNKGKFLVQLEAPVSDSAAWTGKIVQMGPDYSDDDSEVANLHAFLLQLKERDFTAADSGFAPLLPAGAPPDYRIAGSKSCLACHVDSGEIWAHSLHSAAGQTLAARHFDVDPDCLRCHTSGYGLPGGFVSPRTTPLLYGVGCEDCHGPSEAHVENPRVRTQYSAFDQCIRCHDEENSPAFNRDKYWKLIRHKNDATSRPTKVWATQ